MKVVEDSAVGHNLAGDAANVEVRETRGNIRKRSRNSRDTPISVLAESIA